MIYCIKYDYNIFNTYIYRVYLICVTYIYICTPPYTSPIKVEHRLEKVMNNSSSRPVVTLTDEEKAVCFKQKAWWFCKV